MDPLVIAARSVIRSRRRTLVTTASMTLAGTIMVIYASLISGLTATLERNAVALELGEAQVHAVGYRRDPDLYTRIDDVGAFLRQLELQGFSAAPRLRGYGLAAAGLSSAGVEIRGVALEREPTVTELSEHIAQGGWLSSDDAQGVVLGQKLARVLRVKPGDEVVFVGQAADGSTANDLFYVRGVLARVGDVLDRSGFLVAEASFRSLMAVPTGFHEIAIRDGSSGMTADELAEQVRGLRPELETLSWRALQPAVARVIDSSDASSFIMQLITYAAIAMVVLNATLMSVFERIREFGIMKALGVGPGGVAAIVFFEVLLQVGVAGVLSLVMGGAISFHLEARGIDLSGFMSSTSVSGVAFDPTWYAAVSTASLVGPIVTLMVIALLAAVYPGAKASMLRPLEALLHR